MKRIFQVLLLVAFANVVLHAQLPKREMRATWLATVWALDWPAGTVPANGSESQRQSAIDSQKNGLISILNKLQEANVNAVFFQVRPMADALYRSSYEPWSQYVSSARGADPGYDPLEFAIEEAHKRGMELHAWINPYRYSTSSGSHGNLSTDYPSTHPEWLIDYGDHVKILNPGVPEVVQRIVDIVEEIVTNYNVDGIAFDDYFYVNGKTVNDMDQAQFDAYNPDNLSRADWRRQNCDKMIADVYSRIQGLKPYVTFGVSPAGVAASSSAVADKYGVPPSPGSDWQYNGIYSDPLAWLSEGSVDYISPQIYWTGSTYTNLAPWWSNVANKFGKHFYSSHSLSAMTGADPAATLYIGNEEVGVSGMSLLEQSLINENKSLSLRGTAATDFYFSEVGLQVESNRKNDLNDAPGSVFYSTNKSVGSSFINYLQSEVFTLPALTPAIAWKPAEAQTLVENIALSGQNLSWTYAKENVRYAIYAVPNANRDDAAIFSLSKYLLGVSYTRTYTLPSSISSATHKIAVSVLDRYGNEYAPRVMGESTATAVAAQLVYPGNGAGVIIPAIFRWNEINGADSYFWELAEDAQFTNMICSRETTEPQFFSGVQTNIKENTTYYWRVKTRKVNAETTYSDVWSFTGDKFKITAPANGAQAVSITPQIEWSYVSAATSYVLEISTSAQFTAAQQVYRVELQTNSAIVPENVLTTGLSYYARATAIGSGFEAVSESAYFTVEEFPIPVPEMLSPTSGTTIDGTQISITWKEQAARGFRTELSTDSSFPTRNTTLRQVDAYTFSALYTGLSANTYYLRVRALNSEGLTEPSESISIYLTGVSSSLEINANEFCSGYYGENGIYQLIIDAEKAQPAVISIYSLTGVLLNKSICDLNVGENMISLDIMSYASGLYLMKIEMGNRKKTIKIKK